MSPYQGGINPILNCIVAMIGRKAGHSVGDSDRTRQAGACSGTSQVTKLPGGWRRFWGGLHPLVLVRESASSARRVQRTTATALGTGLTRFAAAGSSPPTT